MDAPYIAEHGLSLALYTDSGLTLFDVGCGAARAEGQGYASEQAGFGNTHVQSGTDLVGGGALVHNAQLAGVDLSSVSRLVFSHGHYDHTGGFVALLEQGAKPEVCFAPGLTDARFSRHVNKPVKNIAIPDVCRRALDSYPAEKKRVISDFTEIEPGMFLTGPIPHLSGEDVGGPFFLDAAGTRPDPIADEQAILFDDGTLVVGCCHAGIINTVRYCQSVKPEIKIRKIIGGLHLLNASQERIDQTKAFLDSLNLEELTAIHCTGVAELTYPLVDKRHI